jgi:MoaA/NifB/PqqE/SkfB family radical SAM enzyme
MFRLTQYMREIVAPTPVRRRAGPVKPVVIWNLTRTCNLRCRHCYTTSADVPFPGELSHEQAMGVLQDLHAFGIPALILSGGEPLSRFDFFTLAERAKELGFRHLSLSTNGTKLAENIDRIADLDFDYVGISLDGLGQMNDWFRGVDGAFDAALAGVRACKARGVKVGLRFTITDDNASFLPGCWTCARPRGSTSSICRILSMPAAVTRTGARMPNTRGRVPPSRC